MPDDSITVLIFLTGEMDFGLMDNQTRPARMSVTESARVSMSALDCELFEKQTKDQNEQFEEKRKQSTVWKDCGACECGVGRPGSVRDGSDAGNGAVEEDGE
jgi:hypothetical protein